MTRQNELLLPGYVAQVCAYLSSSSCFILGSCLHACLSLQTVESLRTEAVYFISVSSAWDMGLEHSIHLIVPVELNCILFQRVLHPQDDPGKDIASSLGRIEPWGETGQSPAVHLTVRLVLALLRTSQ